MSTSLRCTAADLAVKVELDSSRAPKTQVTSEYAPYFMRRHKREAAAFCGVKSRRVLRVGHVHWRRAEDGVLMERTWWLIVQDGDLPGCMCCDPRAEAGVTP